MKLDTADPEFAAGIALYLTGSWHESRQALSSLTKRFPDSPIVHFLMGNTCYFLGELDKSIESYRRALELSPDNALAHYRMGECYFRAGRLLQARESFERVLSFAGQSHAMAAHFVGLINEFLGDDEHAVEGFELLRKESGQSLIANYYLAHLKIKLDRAGEARDLLGELLEQVPDFAAGHYLMGIAHCRLHDLTQAIRCFRRVLELHPQDQRARRWLSQITDVEWP